MTKWEAKRLGDFVTAVSTGPFGSLLHKSDYVTNGVPLVNPINIVADTIVPDPKKLIDGTTVIRLSSYVLQSGDIVVARRGEIGRCAVVGENEEGWICGTGCFFIRPSKQIDPTFLAHLIRSSRYRDQLEAASTGTTMKNLSNSTLGDLRISVPPLPEQQRIVGILDEAFAHIATAKANAEKNLQNARALFESHLQSVFASESQQIPLADLASEITDGDHMPPPKADTGIPFITISNIQKETLTIDFSDTFSVPHEYFDKLKPNKRPKSGDILYTVTGATLGIPVVLTEQADFCFQRHIALIRPKPDTDSRWLGYMMRSPQVFRQATERSTGTAQKTVSLTVLRDIQVPKMTQARQRATADILDTLSTETQQLRSIYTQKRTALDELKAALLHQAFSGAL